MADKSGIVDSYASVLIEIGQEENKLEEFKIDFDDIKEVIEDEVVRIISSKIVSKKDKKELVEVIRNEVSKEIINLILLLIDNEHAGIFEDIRIAYLKKYEIINKTKLVTMTVSKEISDDYQKEVIDKLEKQFDQKIILKVEVDPTIVGGVIIKYDNVVINNTVVNKLKEIKQKLVS